VIDASSHEVLKRVPQVSPFCPNIAVSPENDEVWITQVAVRATSGIKYRSDH